MKQFAIKAIHSAHSFFLAMLLWREKHVKEKTFVIILALIVGIFCGFAALVLKSLIHYISSALTAHMSITGGNYLYLLYPVIGILLTAIYVRFVVRDNISHGVTRVLYAISQNKSRLKKHNIYTSVIASSMTIGFGGSALSSIRAPPSGRISARSSGCHPASS